MADSIYASTYYGTYVDDDDHDGLWVFKNKKRKGEAVQSGGGSNTMVSNGLLEKKGGQSFQQWPICDSGRKVV